MRFKKATQKAKKIILSIAAIISIAGFYCIKNNVLISHAAPGNIPISPAYFPDQNFRAVIASTADKNRDNNLSQQEISAVVNIKARNAQIKDTTGLVYFENLESLDLSNNQISLISFGGNQQLREISLAGNNITEIDVSRLSELRLLDLENNKLTRINIANNPRLTDLMLSGNQINTLITPTSLRDLWYCTLNDNKLTSFDPFPFANISFLDISRNPISSLDFTLLSNLDSVLFGSKELKSVEFSNYGHSNLKNIFIYDVPDLSIIAVNTIANASDTLHFENVKDNDNAPFDISRFGSVKNIEIIDSILPEIHIPTASQLRTLKVTNTQSNLIELPRTNNSPLTSINIDSVPINNLDISKSPNLTTLTLKNTAIAHIDSSKNPKLTSITAQNNLFKSTVPTPSTSDNTLPQGFDLNRVTNLSGAKIASGKLLASDPGVEPITYDYIANPSTGLTVPFKITTIRKIPITPDYFPDNNFREYISATFDLNADDYLDKSELLQIPQMSLDGQQISDATGLSFFTELTSLDMGHNNLSTIDLSHNTKLTRIQLVANNLQTLDISQLPQLNTVSAAINNISTFKTSANNSTVKEITLDNNNLRSIDLSNLSNLTALNVNQNSLRKIDLSHNPKLNHLNIVENYLREIDLSHNPKLNHLNVFENPLTHIDLSHNPELSSFYIYSDYAAQSREVSVYDFDHSFNPGRVVNPKNANYNGGVFTAINGHDSFTYKYETGNTRFPRAQFTIRVPHYTEPPVPTGIEQIPPAYYLIIGSGLFGATVVLHKAQAKRHHSRRRK